MTNIQQHLGIYAYLQRHNNQKILPPQQINGSSIKFKKYTTMQQNHSSIKSSLKIKMKNIEMGEEQTDQSHEVSKQYRNKQMPHKYYRKKLIDSHIKNRIDLNEELQNPPHDYDKSGENKKDRLSSLKAYLDQKQKQHIEKKFNLPKIGKTQNIIRIVEDQIVRQSNQRKSKSGLRKKSKGLSKSIKNITIDKSIESHQCTDKTLEKNFSQRNSRQSNGGILFRAQASKKKISPSMQQFVEYNSLNNKKRRIQLMGIKLNPIQRDPQQNASKFLFQINRKKNQRSHNLLSSELIYKNRKENVQKNVYEQLVRKVLNFN